MHIIYTFPNSLVSPSSRRHKAPRPLQYSWPRLSLGGHFGAFLLSSLQPFYSHTHVSAAHYDTDGVACPIFSSLFPTIWPMRM